MSLAPFATLDTDVHSQKNRIFHQKSKEISEIPFKIRKIPKTTLITYSKDSSHPEKVLTKSPKTKLGILVPRMLFLRHLTM